jgi:hypothetical protein
MPEISEKKNKSRREIAHKDSKIIQWVTSETDYRLTRDDAPATMPCHSVGDRIDIALDPA